jgi:hypothetical protein
LVVEKGIFTREEFLEMEIGIGVLEYKIFSP